MGCGDDEDVFEIEIEGERLVVMSVPERPVVIPPELTDAEAEVLALVVAGHSNADIASHTNRSTRTVANHISSIYQRLGVSGRSALIVRLLAGADED